MKTITYIIYLYSNIYNCNIIATQVYSSLNCHTNIDLNEQKVTDYRDLSISSVIAIELCYITIITRMALFPLNDLNFSLCFKDVYSTERSDSTRRGYVTQTSSDHRHNITSQYPDIKKWILKYNLCSMNRAVVRASTIIP